MSLVSQCLKQAAESFEAAQFDKALASARQGLDAPAPLGMTPAHRALMYQLHVVAGKSLLALLQPADALAHFYSAKELDASKMPALAGASEALKALGKRPSELAFILSLQAAVAAANDNAKKAQDLLREASEAYEAAQDWANALKCLQRCDTSSPATQTTLARLHDCLGDWRAADAARLAVANDPAAHVALRTQAGRVYASRPAQAVLDCRAPPLRPGALDEGPPAFDEFVRRVDSLALDGDLRAAAALTRRDATNDQWLVMDDGLRAVDLLNRAAAAPIACQARAWSVLATRWFDGGDAVLAWHACVLASDLEQASYVAEERCAALSLVARASARLWLVGAQCLLLHPWKHGWRASIAEALRRIARGLEESQHEGSTVVARALEDARARAQWLSAATTSAYMRLPIVAATNDGEAPDATGGRALSAALRAKDVGALRGLSAHATWWVRVIAARGLASLASADATAAEFECVDREGRELLARLSPRRALDPAPPNAAALAWKGLAWFMSTGELPAGGEASLVEAVKLDGDGVPLALELLGRFYMGVRGLGLPHAQPPRSVVRDARQAVQLLGRAVALDPGGEGAVCVLANALHAAGQDEKAGALYKALLKPQPGSTWAWTRLAQTQLRQGQAQAACGGFQHAIQHDERAGGTGEYSLQAWMGLGEAHHALGRLSAAATAFERAAEIDPSLGVAWARLGRCRLEAGEFELAVAALDTAVGLFAADDGGDGKAVVARADLAEALLGRGRQLGLVGATAASRAMLQRACDVAPVRGSKTQADALAELGRQGAAARRAFLSLARNEPWSALAWYDMGRACDDATAMAAAASAAVVLDSADGLNWTLLARALQRAGQPARAQHCLVHALHVEPSGATWLELAGLFLAHSKPLLARRALGQAQSLEPDSSAAWTGHALASTALGEDAAAAFACAANAPGAHWIGHLGLSRALLAKRDWAGLLKSAAVAMTRGAGPEAMALHARALAMCGQRARAKIAYLDAAGAYMEQGDVTGADSALLNAAALMGADEAATRDVIAEQAFARSGASLDATQFHVFVARTRLAEGRVAEAEAELDCVSARGVREENAVLLLRCQALAAAGADATGLAEALLERVEDALDVLPLVDLVPAQARPRLRRAMWTSEATVVKCAARAGVSPATACALFPWRADAWAAVQGSAEAAGNACVLMLHGTMDEGALQGALSTLVHVAPPPAPAVVVVDGEDVAWWAHGVDSKARFLLPWVFAVGTA